LHEGEQVQVSSSSSKEAAKSAAGATKVLLEVNLQRSENHIKENDSYSLVALSEDHKPNLEREKRRIQDAGMTVTSETFIENGQEIAIHRVQKSPSNRLAVSRAFGDFEYKTNQGVSPDEQAVTAAPEVKIHSRNSETDMFLVLACDGVWDVMTNDDVAKFIVDSSKERSNDPRGRLSQIGDELLKESYQRNSQDNMTVVIAALSKTMEQFPGGAIQGIALFSPEPGCTPTAVSP